MQTVKPRQFRFEERDTRIKFAQRIALEAFAGQEARGPEAAFGHTRLGSIFVVHCCTASNAIRLLSSEPGVSPQRRIGGNTETTWPITPQQR